MMGLIGTMWRLVARALLPIGALALPGCNGGGSATVVEFANEAPDVIERPASNDGFSPASPPTAPTAVHVPSRPALWTPPWDADVPDVACSPNTSDPALDAAGGCDFPPSQCAPGGEAGTETAGSHWLTYFTNAACVSGTCRWETKHLYCPNGCVEGRCMATVGTTTAVP